MDDRSRSTSPGLLRGARWKRASYFVTALLLSLVFVAACGSSANSPGVANVDSTASPAASPTSTGSSGNAAAYAQCMRTHGIADYPDPNSQGQFDIKIQKGSDLNPTNPTFQAAQGACKSLEPVPSAAQQQQSRGQLLQYAACMRQNGIADFPDPDSKGNLMITGGSGSDLNPNNPAFQKARQACKSLMPLGGP